MQTRSSANRTKLPSTNESLIGSEQARLVIPDLAGAICLDNTSFARSLYHGLASESSIDMFLKKSRSYSTKERRWKLPRNCTRLFDRDFYTPVRNVVSSILNHFWKDATTQGKRQVVDTHATDLQHSEADPTTHHSRPSLVIKAEGPSFQIPLPKSGEKPAKIGYSNVASCIDVRMEGDELPVDEQLVRIAIHARQLFLHQPNRRFVRMLALTGHQLRLFHFDRSGAQYTPPLDIHEDPHTFVRLILGLSSPHESDIGLDTSIRWMILNGRKAGGALMMRGADDSESLYPLLRLEPFFCRSSISGRSTTCWSVLDKRTDEELLVKSSWRSEDRTSEHIYLQEAVGVAGVVQMVSCEPDRAQTKELRGFGDAVPNNFHNRIETRVVIKRYGKPIVDFTSPKEVLCALRDAIAGHMALGKKGTIHRDVSTQNIVLGKPGAKPGNRGVLIDFDLATHFRPDGANPPADCKIGTRLFQSAMVLCSGATAHPLPHSHIDDIESFFYVLTDIIHAYDQRGAPRSLGSELKIWNEYDGRRLGLLKRAFLMDEPIPENIASRWPKAFMDVFYAFRDFLEPISRQNVLFSQHKPGVRAKYWEAMVLSTENHYNSVLRIFDEGIAALEMAEAEEAAVARPVSSPLPPVTPAFPPLTPHATLKRSCEEDHDLQPPLKRPKTPRPVRIRHDLHPPPNLRGR